MGPRFVAFLLHSKCTRALTRVLLPCNEQLQTEDTYHTYFIYYCLVTSDTTLSGVALSVCTCNNVAEVVSIDRIVGENMISLHLNFTKVTHVESIIEMTACLENSCKPTPTEAQPTGAQPQLQARLSNSCPAQPRISNTSAVA